MRSQLRSSTIVSTLAFTLTCGLATATSFRVAKAEDQIASAAEKSHALSAKELRSIYEDHTWHWKDGAAYFGPHDQTFKAWVGEGPESSYADGSWSVNDQGRLCFRATWYVREGHRGATTCTEHRADDKNIYQRKLPKGDWYIFSHVPAQPGDEVQKLESGDHVSDDYKRNKRYVSTHERRRTKRR
jgi:hypothetical protein